MGKKDKNNPDYIIDLNSKNNKNNISKKEFLIESISPLNESEMKIKNNIINSRNRLYIAYLKALLKNIKELGKTPEEYEEDYFSKHGCNGEVSKLSIELSLIKTKISKDYKSYSASSNFDKHLTELTDLFHLILDSDFKDNDEKIKEAKKLIILMELDYGMPIALTSVVEEVLKELKEKEKETSEPEEEKGLGSKRL